LNWQRRSKKHRPWTLLTFIISQSSLYAQPGIQEFAAVSSEIGSWYFRLFDLLLAMGAICGLLGGLRVYANWQSGRHHIDAQVMGWLFSCLFLSLIWTALRALYGIH